VPTPKAVKQTAKTKPAVKKAASSLIVQGKIRDIAGTPRPGSVPLQRCCYGYSPYQCKKHPGQVKAEQHSGLLLVYCWGCAPIH
jgi:hypothetical protein